MFHRSRRATLSTLAMIFSVLLLIAGISMEMANRKHAQPMATISIACSTAGLIGGITAYVVNRLD